LPFFTKSAAFYAVKITHYKVFKENRQFLLLKTGKNRQNSDQGPML
jgi:hypothetical protein